MVIVRAESISEVGGLRPTGKSFRFVSCVRAVSMSSQIGEKNRRLTFPFSLFFSLPFPFSLPGWPTGWYLDVQKHGFVTDSDPHGSKSGSEGIPWQLFLSRVSWQPSNPAIMSKMRPNNQGFGSSQEIRLEKSCQGMPSDPDLEP